MNWPSQTLKVQRAVKAGIDWFQRTLVADLWHDKKTTGLIQSKQGKWFWYRFYEIEKDTPFFCGRDGVKKYDLAEVEWERRSGYNWGGDYGSHLLKAYNFYNTEASQ
jgi:PelA/Pel-15E family pectate lyase